jgi:hypothetical protein
MIRSLAQATWVGEAKIFTSHSIAGGVQRVLLEFSDRLVDSVSENLDIAGIVQSEYCFDLRVDAVEFFFRESHFETGRVLLTKFILFHWSEFFRVLAKVLGL